MIVLAISPLFSSVIHLCDPTPTDPPLPTEAVRAPEDVCLQLNTISAPRITDSALPTAVPLTLLSQFCSSLPTLLCRHCSLLLTLLSRLCSPDDSDSALPTAVSLILLSRHCSSLLTLLSRRCSPNVTDSALPTVLTLLSRKQPCGLPQMYAQRYGTIPVLITHNPKPQT